MRKKYNKKTVFQSDTMKSSFLKLEDRNFAQIRKYIITV